MGSSWRSTCGTDVGCECVVEVYMPIDDCICQVVYQGTRTDEIGISRSQAAREQINYDSLWTRLEHTPDAPPWDSTQLCGSSVAHPG